MTMSGYWKDYTSSELAAEIVRLQRKADVAADIHAYESEGIYRQLVWEMRRDLNAREADSAVRS